MNAKGSLSNKDPYSFINDKGLLFGKDLNPFGIPFAGTKERKTQGETVVNYGLQRPIHGGLAAAPVKTE